MSWLRQVACELELRRVPRSRRRRILLELRDHIACESGAAEEMGDPAALAGTFADELAAAGARSSAFETFAALAMTAVALMVALLSVNAAGGYPGFANGHSLALFLPGVLGMFVAPQAALVAGSLAALRALRRRRVPRLPAAEVRLITRRAGIALAGGLGTVAGIELYVIDFMGRLPGWWLALAGGLAAIAGGGLLVAARRVVGARGIVCGTDGPAGHIYDDLPLLDLPWLRRRPWRLGALSAVAAGTAITLLEAHAEHSLVEGLQRGVFEGAAAAAGLVLLGRALGAAPASAACPTPLGHSSLALPAQRAGDADREAAEAVLREAFATGRLTLDELDVRVSRVQTARSVADLQALVRDVRRGR